MKLDLVKLDKEVVDIINNLGKSQSRHCAINSLMHLEKAWDLKDIDPEMAVFRAITAEEEAATSIFLALKQKKYTNSNKLKFRNHTYKQAVAPFFQAIGKFIVYTSKLPNFPLGNEFSLKADTSSGKKKLQLVINLPGNKIGLPIPPLHFTLIKNSKVHDFHKELCDITTGTNRVDVIKYLKEIAELRNQILYANQDGIPVIQVDIDGYLIMKQKTVISFLRILCLFLPYKEKANFVQQSLDAFLNMLCEIEDTVEEGIA